MKNEHLTSNGFSWETDVYGIGNQLNRYPFDNVVSFVFGWYPRNINKEDIKILELGSGAGNNLWFMAREGFAVSGIDFSKSAIDFCEDRFQKESLKGDFRVGDFSKLPFEDNSFDLVIDRGSISCCDKQSSKLVFSEVNRVLKKGGKFLFTPYSNAHSSYSNGVLQENGMVSEIKLGLVGVGSLRFYDEEDIRESFVEKMKILSLKHKSSQELINTNGYTHAEWEVILEKVS